MIQRFLLLLFCVFFALPSQASQPLNIAVSRTPLSLPFYVADQQGFFAAENVKVHFMEVIGGHRALQAMLDGKADMATISETGFMFKSFARDNMAILASFVSSNDDIKLVTRASSGIQKTTDLDGKRIGIVAATSSHYLLDTILILDGIDSNRVQTVPMQPENMAKALQSGEVEAVSVWEPFPFNILASIPDAQILAVPRFYTLTFNLVASRKIIDSKHKEDLVKLMRALVHAEQFIAAEPQTAQTILKTHLGLEQPFIDWIWPRYNFRLALDQSLLTTLESEARWARTQGHIKAKNFPNYLEFIYTTPLRVVDPLAVNITE